MKPKKPADSTLKLQLSDDSDEQEEEDEGDMEEHSSVVVQRSQMHRKLRVANMQQLCRR